MNNYNSINMHDIKSILFLEQLHIEKKKKKKKKKLKGMKWNFLIQND